MPSSSAKQHRFMQAVAHSPSFAKKAGVSQSVGKDFSAADKGKTFNKGGDTMESKKMMDKEVAFMKKKGAPSSMIKHEEKESKSMKFAMGGGMPSPGGARPDPRMMAAMRAQQAARQQPMRRPPPGGTPPPAQPPMGMNKGGMAHGGMHKMPDGKMMKNSDMKMRGMKEGGMPMKDGKPAFMQKKMMGGGMAKYAKGGSIRRMADGGMTAPMAPSMAPQQPPVDPRQMAAMQAAMQAQGGAAPMAPGMKRGGSVGFAKGGGIESRGKTKGTVIRMAAGGSVSSRADGIAQRGKTKFTNY